MKFVPINLTATEYKQCVRDNVGYCLECCSLINNILADGKSQSRCVKCGNKTAIGIKQVLLMGIINLVENIN